MWNVTVYCGMCRDIVEGVGILWNVSGRLITRTACHNGERTFFFGPGQDLKLPRSLWGNPFSPNEVLLMCIIQHQFCRPLVRGCTGLSTKWGGFRRLPADFNDRIIAPEQFCSASADPVQLGGG